MHNNNRHNHMHNNQHIHMRSIIIIIIGIIIRIIIIVFDCSGCHGWHGPGFHLTGGGGTALFAACLLLGRDGERAALQCRGDSAWRATRVVRGMCLVSGAQFDRVAVVFQTAVSWMPPLLRACPLTARRRHRALPNGGNSAALLLGELCSFLGGERGGQRLAPPGRVPSSVDT